MKLSIITVNLNNAAGLQKTIDSVFSQTWLDFEFIIIDGGSTDGSKELICQYANMPIKLKFSWISEADTGVFNAMNKGIKMALGEYLLFLNSGDFLENKNVLEDVFNERDYSEDILCGQCNVSDKGSLIYQTNPPDDFKLSYFYKSTIAHQSTFIKSSLFLKYGLYREDLKFMSDWEFWIRTIILENISTRKINVIISEYNLDGMSSLDENKEKMSEECKRVYIDLHLDKIIPDYEYWEIERERMKRMYWAKSKKIISFPIDVLYKIVSMFHIVLKK